MSNIEVIGLGALNVDHIYQVERLLKDEETVAQSHRIPEYEAELQELGLFPGGSAANTIYGLAKLGISTGFIGAIGNDAAGKLLLQDFQRVGVDTSQIKVKPGAKTGLAFCLSDKFNFRSIHITPGVNDLLTMGDVDLDYVNQARILHISSFVGDQQLKLLLELMSKLDFSVKVSFSPGALYASKGLQTLTPLLVKTYVLFVNESEMRQLTGDDFHSGAKRCLDLGCHIAVVTLGQGMALRLSAGADYSNATCYIRTAEQEYAIEQDRRNLFPEAETTGAGDAFAAGFLYGLLTTKGLNECGRLGNIVARFSLAKSGARQGLPTFDELARRYRDLYLQSL